MSLLAYMQEFMLHACCNLIHLHRIPQLLFNRNTIYKCIRSSSIERFHTKPWIDRNENIEATYSSYVVWVSRRMRHTVAECTSLLFPCQCVATASSRAAWLYKTSTSQRMTSQRRAQHSLTFAVSATTNPRE